MEDLSELKNVDKRKEDQQEQDVKDRKEGFLTYLGESVLENDRPWYATKRGEREEFTDAEKRTKGKLKVIHFQVIRIKILNFGEIIIFLEKF